MNTEKRKLLTIITEAILEQELTGKILHLGARGYTVTDARGKGHRGVRADSWEANANIRIEVVCDEKTAHAVATHLKEHYYGNYAMVLFMSDVEVMRPEKF